MRFPRIRSLRAARLGSRGLWRAGAAEPADTGGDLLAGAGQIEAPGMQIVHPVEDEIGLVPVQLADFEGDDPALTVGKHAEWQDRIHSERADGVQALLLADQHRIVDTDVVCVLEDRVAEVHGDPDYLQGLRRAFPPQALEQGNLLAARLAPGGPEVHQ